MDKNTGESRDEKEKQEQKLETLLIERLQNKAVIEFDISQVKAEVGALKKRPVEQLQNKTT